MNLTNLIIEEYIATVASDAPAPGGGSASALAGAQGAGLVAMVAGLTAGRKKYAEHKEFCEGVRSEGKRLAAALTAQVDADTAAYELVAAAFKLPKETEEEQTARRAAIAAATLTATEAPFLTMSLALDGLRLAKSLLGRYNTNCASDLGVAALGLNAAVRGAWLNVLINIPGLADPAAAERFETAGTLMLAEAVKLEGDINKSVIASIG